MAIGYLVNKYSRRYIEAIIYSYCETYYALDILKKV